MPYQTLLLCVDPTGVSFFFFNVLFYIYNTIRCAFFVGEIDKPAQGILQRGKRKAVNVGICLEGVYVTDVKEKVRRSDDTTPCSCVVAYVDTKHYLFESILF